VWIHAERRKPGVTLKLLHLGVLGAAPGGLPLHKFCEFYRRWLKLRGLSNALPARTECSRDPIDYVDY
jgi:hypothetical protein